MNINNQNKYIDVILKGQKFSPKKFKKYTSFPFKIIVEYGHISKKGRYKNKPSPFGIGVLELDYSEKVLINFCDNISSQIENFNIDEIVINIGNSSFNISTILYDKIFKLGAKINFID